MVTQSPTSPRGKVCVGDTKPSHQLKRWTVQSVTKKVAVDTASCYNPNELGIRLAVGRRTLNPLGQVRILDPQPNFAAHSSRGLGHLPLKEEITGSNPVCATKTFTWSAGKYGQAFLLASVPHAATVLNSRDSPSSAKR